MARTDPPVAPTEDVPPEEPTPAPEPTAPVNGNNSGGSSDNNSGGSAGGGSDSTGDNNSGGSGNNDPHQPPSLPTPEEIESQIPLDAPEAVDPAAVETVSTPEGDKKYGWQEPADKDFTPKDPCVHMGIVQARKQIVNHELGHEWVCTCGTIFELTLNKGGKATLSEKPYAAQLPELPETP